MRNFCFIVVLMCVFCFFVGTGCTNKGDAAQDSIVDTLSADTMPYDSLEVLMESTPMPKAADELFDDFIFNFASNRKLQKERTDFPFVEENNGIRKTIAEKKWVTERFFMKQGYYTLIFNSRKQFAVGKDTTIKNAVVEKFAFENNEVRQWMFARVDGVWRMQSMIKKPISQHHDADFLHFYNKFATDTAFQIGSLAEAVSISAPDPDDDFSRMDGEVIPEQWPAFAPWLPSGVIYNIHYGKDKYKDSHERIFLIRGVANGMETELTFRKINGKWVLTRMES